VGTRLSAGSRWPLAISIISIAELQFGVLVYTRNPKDLAGLHDLVTVTAV
jgi:uncharacterized membrane protein